MAGEQKNRSSKSAIGIIIFFSRRGKNIIESIGTLVGFQFARESTLPRLQKATASAVDEAGYAWGVAPLNRAVREANRRK